MRSAAAKSQSGSSAMTSATSTVASATRVIRSASEGCAADARRARMLLKGVGQDLAAGDPGTSGRCDARNRDGSAVESRAPAERRFVEVAPVRREDVPENGPPVGEEGEGDAPVRVAGERMAGSRRWDRRSRRVPGRCGPDRRLSPRRATPPAVRRRPSRSLRRRRPAMSASVTGEPRPCPTPSQPSARRAEEGVGERPASRVISRPQAESFGRDRRIGGGHEGKEWGCDRAPLGPPLRNRKSGALAKIPEQTGHEARPSARSNQHVLVRRVLAAAG